MKTYPNKAIYNKLVRDKIPEIIRNNGLSLRSKVLSADEAIVNLRDKLMEEAKELQEELDLAGVKEEMADLLEVMYSLAREMNFEMAEVEKLRCDKAISHGSFTKRIYLIETSKEEE